MWTNLGNCIAISEQLASSKHACIHIQRLYLDGKLAKEGSIIKGKAHIEWSPDAEEYDSNSMGGCYECCGGAGTKQCSIQ